jgi:tetratricopeptide (TPR) repeat protein
MAQGLVWIDLNVRQDPDRARDRLRSMMEADRFNELDPLTRNYRGVIRILSRVASLEETQAMIAEFEAEVPEEYRLELEDEYLVWEGNLLSREGRHEEAIAALRRRETPGCSICRHLPLAEAYDRAGERDSAIAYHADYANAHNAYRVWWDQSSLGPSLERLGQLYDEAGDLENAALYYARFVELWEDADAELQPRVGAARSRLEEIIRERG